jgi:hypothetical protein
MPSEPVAKFIGRYPEDLSDDTFESVLEPFDGLITLDLVGRTNVGLAPATLGNTLTRSGPMSCQHCGYHRNLHPTYMQQ